MKHYCDVKLLKTIPNIIFYYWKQQKLLSKKEITSIREFSIKTYSRSSTILPFFNFCLFQVHNGQRFSKVFVTKNHFFYKIGEFSLTKVICRHNKKKRKNR